MKSSKRQREPMADDDLEGIPEDLRVYLSRCQPVDEVLREWQTIEKIDWKRDPVFVSEYLKAEFMNGVWVTLEEQGLSQSELAERIGWSRQYASRVLNSQMNLTIDTMARLACALDLSLSIKLHRRDEHIEVVPKSPVERRAKPVAYARESAEEIERPNKATQSNVHAEPSRRPRGPRKRQAR